jgi:hypothetical protein
MGLSSMQSREVLISHFIENNPNLFQNVLFEVFHGCLSQGWKLDEPVDCELLTKTSKNHVQHIPLYESLSIEFA